jgi:hypothetical protein
VLSSDGHLGRLSEHRLDFAHLVQLRTEKEIISRKSKGGGRDRSLEISFRILRLDDDRRVLHTTALLTQGPGIEQPVARAMCYEGLR